MCEAHLHRHSGGVCVCVCGLQTSTSSTGWTHLKEEEASSSFRTRRLFSLYPTLILVFSLPPSVST